MNKNFIKIILISITVILTIVEGGYLLLLPAAVNSGIKSGKYTEALKQKTGLSLSYDKLKIRTYPDFSLVLSAENLKILDKQEEKVFSSKNLKTSVFLPSLVFNKFTLRKFKADELFLVLSADNQKNVYFSDISLSFLKDDKLNFNANLNGIKLNDSLITLVDNSVKKRHDLKIQNAEFYYKKNSSAGLLLKSKIYTDGKENTNIDIKYFSKLPLQKGLEGDKFSLRAAINNFDFSNYSLYLAALYPEVQNITGVLNAEFANDEQRLNLNAVLKGFSVNMKNPLDSIVSDSDINLSTQMRFAHSKLIFDELKLFAKNWNIVIDGSIKNYASDNLKSIKPDLNVTVKNSDIHSLYWLLPSIKDDPMQVMQKFKKYGAWGIADGKLQIKGTAQLPLVYGTMNLSDVYIVKNNPLVEHCIINTEFLGDKLKLKTRVWAGHGEWVDIEGVGEMTFYSKGEFWVKSSPAVDLATAEYMLVPIHEIVGFDLGPVPFMTVKGKGNIDIHTKGTVLDGEVEGRFNFSNVEATLDGLNTVLSNANGALAFDKRDIHFYTTKANIKNYSVKIDGKANLNGNIDFDVTSDNIEASELLNILNTSDIVAGHKYLAEPVESLKGNTSVKLKILGVVKDFATIKENETLVIKGALGLKNVTGRLKLCPVSLNKIQGDVSFDNDGWKLNLNGIAETSKIFIEGMLHKNKVQVLIKGASVKTDDLIKLASKINSKEFKQLAKIGKTNSLLDFTSEYKSNNGVSSEKFSLNDLNAKGRFYPQVKSTGQGLVEKINGEFILSRGILTLKNFRANTYGAPLSVDARVSNILDKRPVINGKVNLRGFELRHLGSARNVDFLPESVKNILIAHENYQGSVDVDLKIKNNNLNGYIDLSNIKFNHSYFKTPVSVDSGKIILDDSKVTIKSMVANVDETPVFVNFSVWDFDKTMKFDGYFTTKLTDKFANKYINSLLTYPIKPKGDITVTADVNGTLESINLHPKLSIASNADIYYMGANLGDTDTERELKADLNVTNNRYALKKLEYVRYMTSQNDRSYPLTILTASGVFDKINDKGKRVFYIRNCNIHTLNNANVKIFNVLFKKSVLKNGMFNCRLNLKGNINSPVVRGNVSMTNIDMPLFETLVKNISLKFNDNNVDIVADGEVLNSDFKLNAVMKNTTRAPYVFENIDIKSKKLNLDNFINSLTRIPTPDMSTKLVQSSNNSIPVNVSDVQIQKGALSVDEIVIRDLEASNLYSEFTLGKSMLLDIQNLWFDVEGGKMEGVASYNFANGKIKAAVTASNVDSNKVASNLFGVKDQIFGQANGNIVVSTKGMTEEERIKNLFGNVYFEIVDGKMPKLGSVEYLLKAGNLIKSGITGASLNNFIELLAPVKTGYFDSIKGNFALKNGIAQNIEVYSKGDNLNLFINGDYDLLLQYANLQVFGRLTRKAVNILGPVGNLSFNSLLNSIPGIKFDRNDKNTIVKELNKIPGVELSDKEYRIFTVKIDGHFNDDKFVKNFRWIE